MNVSIKAISEDTNTFGLKWDNELERHQVLMNIKIEDANAVILLEQSKVLDE
jgi:hypothetical protein